MVYKSLRKSAGITDKPARPLPDPAKSAELRLNVRVKELISDREGPLPVWVRAPKSGLEFFSGTSRSKLYEWAGNGYIRSASIRRPGQVRGVRLFHLQSILSFIEQSSNEVANE